MIKFIHKDKELLGKAFEILKIFQNNYKTIKYMNMLLTIKISIICSY